MKKTSNPSESGGPTPPPGPTPGRVEALAASGSLPRFWSHPGFMYRQEGQCFVLTPDRRRQILMTVIVAIPIEAALGVFAYWGALLLQSSWLAWHGTSMPGMSLTPRTDTPGLIVGAVIGAVLFLLFGVLPAGIVWSNITDLLSRNRPSVLDRGRGEFRVGARVVCGLGDIARLQLYRGHNPEAPENLADARYVASFVLQDGRRFGLCSYEYKSTELGNGVAGAQIEAVMAAVAAFLGVEYALMRWPDDRLRPGPPARMVGGP